MIKKLWCPLFGHKFESVGRAHMGSWTGMGSWPVRVYEIFVCARCGEDKMVKIDE